ncbi:PHP domain-containing protein [Fibrobacter sp.]|uniref:PHP domain-containing protein n=1 Tax=Fibrobacter sp. TaxID=35828 RepID=UPI00388DFE5B
MHYAETHFKFKLPWSLLYRPWPEIFTDAPFQFVPGKTPLLWIVVRDAHRFPATVKSLEISIRRLGENSPDETRRFDHLDLKADQPFHFFPVGIGALEPGLYEIFPKVVACRNGKERTFQRWNFPGLKPSPLKIQVLRHELPKPEGYAAGEMHCHTYYSADHVEYGASPAVMQQAAEAVGLDFVNFTDHAYDFAFTVEDYTKEAPSASARFQNLKDEIAALPAKPLLIAGEEISAGNSKGENVHMTALGPTSYLPGLGDCGRYWLNNRPTLPIGRILEMTDAPCFAAHPLQQMGALEKFIFRRGYWKTADLHLDAKHPVRGIQFWNGIRDEGFKLGRAWWIDELGKGNFLLPIGGNDAHGDLNDTTFVRLPLFSLGNNRHHVFGRVRTAVLVGGILPNICHPERSAAESKDPGPQFLTQEKLKAAFSGDNCYITDGPALWWDREVDAVKFHAQSTQDLGGGFRYIRIYGRRILAGGKWAAKEEICPESLVAASQNETITVHSSGYAYLRAECETSTGRFAMTSAALCEH